MKVVTESIKNHPWLTTLATVFLTYLTVMLLVTKGPSVRIETTPASQDYVIKCGWDSSMFVVHGGRRRAATRIAVISSDETYSCGYSLLGALMYSHPNVTYLHPVYTGGESSSWEEIDGVQVIKPITKLEKLDEQKAKFEAGYFDKQMNPGAEYAHTMGGCGFPHQYFKYYSKVKKVDKEYFREKYHDYFLECKKRVLPIKNKYLRHTYRGERPSPEKSMEILWDSKGWE